LSAVTNVDIQLVAIVCLAVACVWLIKRWGPFPSRDPDKAARWQVLPLRFKFACWFGVTPLFAIGIVLLGILKGYAALAGLGIIAVAWICMVVLEGRVVSWYRANGHFRTYQHENGNREP
jgi:hypothetical protein